MFDDNNEGLSRKMKASILDCIPIVYRSFDDMYRHLGLVDYLKIKKIIL